MMAMNLYGRGAGGDPDSINPYSSHTLLHGQLAQNSVEIQARSLPRPRRKSRRPRVEEKPLFPSIEAIEDLVPDAIVSIKDGTLDIRISTAVNEPMATEDNTNTNNNNNKMEAEQEEDEEEKKPAALSLALPPTKPVRRRSSNSSSSGKLDTAFRGLSLKRKPINEDTPMGSALNLTAPRRKVCRRGSNSSASVESGDSLGSSHNHNHNYGPPFSHRRTDSVDTSSSSESDSTALGRTPPHNNRHSTTPPFASGRSSLMSGGPLSFSKMATTSTTTTTTSSSSISSRRASQPSTSSSSHEIQVQPGLVLPLRSRDETKKAIKTGFVEEVFCQSCDLELVVVADANYCLCPDCKAITPVDGMASFHVSKKNSAGSVGIGLRADDAQW